MLCFRPNDLSNWNKGVNPKSKGLGIKYQGMHAHRGPCPSKVNINMLIGKLIERISKSTFELS